MKGGKSACDCSFGGYLGLVHLLSASTLFSSSTQGLVHEAADVLRISARMPRAKCGGGVLLLLALIEEPNPYALESGINRGTSYDVEAAAIGRLEADLLASQDVQSCNDHVAVESEEGSLLLTFLSGRLAKAVSFNGRSSSSRSGALNLFHEARRLRRDFLSECTSLAVFWHFLELLPDAPAFYAKLEEYRYEEQQRLRKRKTDHSLTQQQQPRPHFPPLPTGAGPPFLLPVSSEGDNDSRTIRNTDSSSSSAPTSNEGLHVVVQWYQAKAKPPAKSPLYALSARAEAEAHQRAQQRQLELDACLRANLENPAVAQVIDMLLGYVIMSQ